MAGQAAKISANLQREIERIVSMLVLDIDSELRKATPIDTGHARDNWVPSVGAPHTGEVSGGGAHDAGVQEVLAYKLGAGKLFITNGASYINRLNYGHSKQAPAGFVERAVGIAAQRMATKLAAEHRDVTGDVTGDAARSGGK